MHKATGFISGSSLPEWSRGRVEASTRELIDGCSMAIGPLDCGEAIVDVLKATDVQWGIPEHTAVQRRSGYLDSVGR